MTYERVTSKWARIVLIKAGGDSSSAAELRKSTVVLWAAVAVGFYPKETPDNIYGNRSTVTLTTSIFLLRTKVKSYLRTRSRVGSDGGYLQLMLWANTGR